MKRQYSLDRTDTNFSGATNLITARHVVWSYSAGHKKWLCSRFASVDEAKKYYEMRLRENAHVMAPCIESQSYDPNSNRLLNLFASRLKLLQTKHLNWLFILLVLFSLIDRLYWVGEGDGLSGWKNVSNVPAEFSACTGHSVEYKIEGKMLRYRCSLIGGDLPFWPFYSSGAVASE